MHHFHCSDNHVDTLGVLSWLLVLVWALVGPMFNRTISKAALILLVLLEVLLALLFKVGIVLDTVLSLVFVGLMVPLIHHVGDRSPFGPFSMRVLCP